MVGGKGGGGVRGFFWGSEGDFRRECFCWVGGFLGWGGGKGFFWVGFLWDCTFCGTRDFFWELEKSLYRNLVRFRF